MAEVNDNSSIQLFEDQKIRTAWDAEKEEWYFSIIDVISVLTGTANPRRYWSDLKRKLKAEGANELYEKIVQLKMLSSDGKRYKTDVAIGLYFYPNKVVEVAKHISKSWRSARA